MNIIIRRWLDKCKRRIEGRLDESRGTMTFSPEFGAGNIHYEVAERTSGIAYGGIGAIHLLAQRIGLPEAIDRDLHLLKFHLPYHESDHVLNIAYNGLCGGTCLQDIELRRNDENYLNALSCAAFPIPPRPATSAAASRVNTSIPSSTSSTVCV